MVAPEATDASELMIVVSPPRGAIDAASPHLTQLTIYRPPPIGSQRLIGSEAVIDRTSTGTSE